MTTALGLQNVILPSGTVKMGSREYFVRLNSTPDSVHILGDMPIREVNGRMIYVRDVAQVRDGSGIQTNIVRNNGNRGLYLTMLKNGGVSTLSVVNRVKAMLPQLKATLPPDVELQLLADQSIYVSASIRGVIHEGVIAACLTALMILIFLGSGRSTLIVATSIPLSILTSIICLSLLGQTLNVMTLTGLALAVGILVDDATVAIENIHRNLQQGKDLTRAIIDGSDQIAVPALVSTLAICIVFLPVFALSGPAAALFQPLAMSVIFAMLASYFLSRTLVPTMAKYMLREPDAHGAAPQGWFGRAAAGFQRGFDVVPRCLPLRAGVGGAAPTRGSRDGGARRSQRGGNGAASRSGLLSAGRRRPVPAPRARADGNARRGDRAARSPTWRMRSASRSLRVSSS